MPHLPVLLQRFLAIRGSAITFMSGYGVSGRDPLTYTAIVVLLGATALLAAYLPTRRAMRVDPVVALSAE